MGSSWKGLESPCNSKSQKSITSQKWKFRVWLHRKVIVEAIYNPVSCGE